ncbi:SxtJ family membrane protein [Rhodobacter sp. SY28-1]|uniref:SxtJ family membrane protein n=1 Tax=Rhodobacter sp. SY28-1 TaxID=2562317 RepID=UPI0010C0672D|nr:SxtJ family membrane protein [Rhodobacter sp. SY28-1]
MAENDDHTEVEIGSPRSFGIVFAVVFAIVALFPFWHGNAPRIWALVVCAVFGGLALARPSVLDPLNRLWFHFGMLLSKIISPIVMGIIFFGTVTPTAWVMRARGRDLLSQQIDKDAKSYWIKVEPTPESSMRKQF